MLPIIGSIIGQDNELCYPSYKNKKNSETQKQYKGYTGLIINCTVNHILRRMIFYLAECIYCVISFIFTPIFI